ncbi:uncharacterized protein K444DRAFT_523799, partial [Hyaloscypha bicolor E]
VLQITIEANKYNLNIALKYIRPRGKPEREDMGYLLVIAFLFGNIDIFIVYTLALILYYTGSYLKFLNNEITSQIIPWKTFYM